MNHAKQSSILLYVYVFFSRFISVIPYYALFLQNIKHFNSSQILIFFSLYGIGNMAFEIPTGVIADKYGVKLSIVVGHIFRFLSIVVLLLSSNFFMVLVSQLILACGDSLLSGSEDTYFFSFYHNNENYFNKRNYSFEVFISKLHSLNWFGVASSFFIGSLCAYFGLLIPFIQTAIIYAICILVAMLFPTVRYDQQNKNMKSPFTLVFKEIIHSRELMSWVLVSVIINTSLSVVYLLIQPLMNEYHFAGSLNGVIFGLTTILASVGAYMQPKFFSQKNTRQSFSIILLFFLLIISTAAITINKNFVMFIFLFSAFRFIFGMFSPLLSARTNMLIKSNSYRTTIISAISLLGGIVQAALLIIVAGVGRNDIHIKFIFVIAFMFTEMLFIFYLNSRIKIKENIY